MSWRRWLLLAALLLYTLSWALPTLPLPFVRQRVAPGWLAFRLALGPLAPVRLPVDVGAVPLHPTGGYVAANDSWSAFSLYGVASALTNLAFLILLVVAAARRPLRWFTPAGQRRMAFAAGGIALFNIGWIPLLTWSSDDPLHLGPGYYAWLAAFVLLALALGHPRRRRGVDAVARGETRSAPNPAA